MNNVGTNRRLAAILAADVVGYSSMMEDDEAGTLTALNFDDEHNVYICPHGKPQMSSGPDGRPQN